VLEGVASWYGPRFDGKKTANGERFDQDALTAAHATIAFGSKVRVTNLENGRKVVVRINDRPGDPDRIIDLSRAAGKALGIIHPGTARVRLEVLD
jgi:rare lipoprotein A